MDEIVSRIPFSVMRPGVDHRDLPVYSLAEAAAFLDIPNSTLRWWVVGGVSGPSRHWNAPLIERPVGSSDLISFNNLAELHILSVTTKQHKLKLKAIRDAVEHVKSQFPSAHPLLSEAFFTDGKDLFIKTIQQTINVTKQGQLALKPILDLYLERIVRDDQFMPVKIYPLTRGQQSEKVVSIIPTVSSGRPVIDGYGVPVSSIWGRFRGGDSPDLLAEDYEIPLDRIKGAIKYVEHYAAA
ncbi:MAG: DUF433 domain-containing protein [Terracidiphilus sp.]|nr:DUF433 domain-containing protein [Terracidiphilus sp.]